MGEYSFVDLKFVGFCPKFNGDSYLEFQKKLFWEKISEIFMQTKAILYQNLCKISPYFLQILFCIRIVLKTFTQVLSYVACTQVRRHLQKWITKSRYGVEKPSLVFRKLILFTLGLGLTTYYTVGDLVWNFYQTFVTVSIKFLMRFEPQISPTRLAINILFITAEPQMKLRLCVKLFDFFVDEYSSIWPEIFRVLSQIQWRFLPRISGKNYFGRIF